MNLPNTRATERGEVAIQEEPSQSQLSGGATSPKESVWSKLIPHGLAEVVLLALVVSVISLQLKYLLEVRTEVPHQDDWNLLDRMFQSVDSHRVGAWILSCPNGHFIVPAVLASLVSLRYSSLDLTWMRLLNFPICVVAFFLTAHVINVEVRSRFLRFYLYVGACLLIFNLCLWAHFALACGFTAILSALFGGIGLYYFAKATQASAKWKNHLLIGLGFLIASVLSLGAGYAATAAAISLLTFSWLKKLAVSRPIPKYRTVIYCFACTLAFLAIASHPFFQLKSRIIQAVFHSVLVAGSIGSSFLDTNSLLAQEIAFACGIILVVASLSIGFDFLAGQRPSSQLLPTFSISLVMFGLFGCVAVAIARAYFSSGEFLNSRYTLYPSVCLLGILLYLARRRSFWLANTWCFIAVGYLLGTIREEQVAFFRPPVYRRIEVAMNNADNLSDEQLRATLYFRINTKGVRRVVARMRHDRLNVFRGSPDLTNGPH